jgi:hypothetical protein
MYSYVSIDIHIPEEINEKSLEEFGVSNEKVQGIAVLLRDEYNQSLSEENILGLTVKE